MHAADDDDDKEKLWKINILLVLFNDSCFICTAAKFLFQMCKKRRKTFMWSNGRFQVFYLEINYKKFTLKSP